MDVGPKILRNGKAHLRNTTRIRRLIRGTGLADELFWYDLPLRKALGWGGLWRFWRWRRQRRGNDQVARNFNIEPLYWGPPLGDGRTESGATVWNHRKLQNEPVVEGDEVCHLLEAHAPAIRSEYNDYKNFLETHPDNADLANNGRWSGLFLYGVKGKNSKCEHAFPRTFEVLRNIPLSTNFGFVLVSRLAPGTRVLPHCGSSNLRFRYHLALEASEGDAVRIRVGDQMKSWRTGEAFGFDDSFEHEVIHDGAKDRTVIIVDTWNPELPPSEREILDDDVFSRFGRSA